MVNNSVNPVTAVLQFSYSYICFSLQNKVLSGLTKNKNLIDSYHECLVQRESECQERLEESLSREKKCEQVDQLTTCCILHVRLSFFFKQECKQLQKEYQAKVMECAELKRVCGRLMARAAVACAESKTKDDLINDITSRSREITPPPLN